jgi:hypothetical protein
MQLTGVFPDAEMALIGWLKLNLPEVVWYSELPLDWNPPTAAYPLPAGLVQRIPAGSGGQEYESTPTLDINLYTGDRASLWALVQRTEPVIVAFPRQSAGPYVDNLTWKTPFGFMAYENRAVRRAFGSVELLTRPQAVT